MKETLNNTESSNSTKPVLCNGLRIGNYLKFKNTNDLAIVEIMHKQHFDCRDEYGMFTPNGNYEPIELTEEWLVKLGFEMKGFYRLKVTSFLELCWKPYDKTLNIQTEKNGFTEDSKVKYVHQLQNLYFALTQRELTVA